MTIEIFKPPTSEPPRDRDWELGQIHLSLSEVYGTFAEMIGCLEKLQSRVEELGRAIERIAGEKPRLDA